MRDHNSINKRLCSSCNKEIDFIHKDVTKDAEIIEKALELSEFEDGEGKIVGYTVINEKDINKAIIYTETIDNKRKLITSSDKTIIDSMEKNEWVGKKIKFKESRLVS